MIKRLFTLLYNLKEQQVFVGRWTIANKKNNKQVINIIVDRNNEDHCGTCVRELTNSKDNINIEKEKYYLPFTLNS